VEDSYIVHSLTNGIAAAGAQQKTGGEGAKQGGTGGFQGGSAEGGATPVGVQRNEDPDSPHTLYMGICRLDASHPHRRIDLKAACTTTLPYAFLCFTGTWAPSPPPA